MGLYRRSDSKFWWMAYKDGAGRQVCESTGCVKKTAAVEKLRFREGQVVDHRFPGLHVERTTFGQLADLIIDDYAINDRKSLAHLTNLVNRLRRHFGDGTKAIEIPNMIKDFKKALKKRGLENAYINRHLAALRRMFSLGYDHRPRLVTEKLGIEMLVENNVRTGFYEHAFYLQHKSVLPAYLKIALTITYLSGIRKEECLSLRRSAVDFVSGYVSLSPLDTKTREPRGFFLRAEYYEDLLAWEQQTARLYPDCQYVVHREGRRINDFRDAWDTSLIKLGKAIKYQCRDCRKITERTQEVRREGMTCAHCKSQRLRRDDQIFHDLRRTAVRTMIDAGVSEKDAMYISGHKTTAMLHRYKIVNRKNLESAADKTIAYLHAEEERQRDRA